jgi:hypothetical protein
MVNKISLLVVIVILIPSSILLFSCKSKWDNTSYLDKIESITIYSVDIQSGMNYDKKKLSEVGSTTIDNPKAYFSKITYKDEMVIWKGDKLGIVHMKDGSELKIRVSNYGEFFSVIGKGGYYEYEKLQK